MYVMTCARKFITRFSGKSVRKSSIECMNKYTGSYLPSQPIAFAPSFNMMDTVASMPSRDHSSTNARFSVLRLGTVHPANHRHLLSE